MAKAATAWVALDGSSTATQTSGGYLLLENGVDALLLEDGASFLLLEDATLTQKEDTLWDTVSSRNAAGWASDGNTTYTQGNSGVQRTQQDTTVRVTQDGTTRILQENVGVPKAPTTWDTL